MKNIYSYIINNKDEKFENISALDALVFARLSYVHFEKFQDKLPVKISSLKDLTKGIKMNSHDKKMLDLISNSKRYQDLEIVRCKSILDKDKEEQFLAITIILPYNEAFISFRGTNKNLIGFKEDMNMSFKDIPSQFDAKDYLNSEKKYKKIYLGGHSKGGNLAMFAGIYAKNKSRIAQIYNFDGPGFLELDDNFYKMKKKIINYFPCSSIVGRLMYNDAFINPIVTQRQGIEAHNVYNWRIIGCDFEYGILTKNSDDFHNKCLEVINYIAKENREIIINYVYNLILKGEIKNIKEISIEEVKSIISNAPKINKKDKELLSEFMKILMKNMLPRMKKK